ncbi:MAG: hypothetical protein GY801_49000 [bacterium]|nr:hypothetical protein [bacterium]
MSKKLLGHGAILGTLLLAQTAIGQDPGGSSVPQICSKPAECASLSTASQFSAEQYIGEAGTLVIQNFVDAYRVFDEKADYYAVTQYVAAYVQVYTHLIEVEVRNELPGSAGLSETEVVTGSAYPESSSCSDGDVTQTQHSFDTETGVGGDGPTFTLSENMTWSNSQSVTCPDLQIVKLEEGDGNVRWTYSGKAPSNLDSGWAFSTPITMTNQWIWKVPWSDLDNCQPADSTGGQNGLSFKTKLSLTVHGGSTVGSTKLDTDLAAPFGGLCEPPAPVLTGTTPSCVNTGGLFAIEGESLFSVSDVRIAGTALEPENYSVFEADDSRIYVIVPPMIEGNSLVVRVTTSGGESVSNATITIVSPEESCE